MARGMLAGGSDYSDQSFEDVRTDLAEWRRAVKETTAVVNDLWRELEDTPEWRELSPDLKAAIAKSIRLLETARVELAEILDDFEDEVRSDHVTRLRRLAEQAHLLNTHVGRIWNSREMRGALPDDEERRWQVERLYGESRDMLADMLDMGNAAHRLGDFVGRRPRRILRLSPEKGGFGIDLRRLWRRLFHRT